jgi:hypothetical protein
VREATSNQRWRMSRKSCDFSNPPKPSMSATFQRKMLSTTWGGGTEITFRQGYSCLGHMYGSICEVGAEGAHLNLIEVTIISHRLDRSHLFLAHLVPKLTDSAFHMAPRRCTPAHSTEMRKSTRSGASTYTCADVQSPRIIVLANRNYMDSISHLRR